MSIPEPQQNLSMCHKRPEKGAAPEQLMGRCGPTPSGARRAGDARLPGASDRAEQLRSPRRIASRLPLAQVVIKKI